MTTIVDGTTGITFPSTISGVSATQQYSGRVLQVVSNTYSTSTSTTSTSFVVTGLTATITPTSATSKIFVATDGCADTGSSGEQTTFTIFRDSTNIAPAGTNGMTNIFATSTRVIGSVSMVYLDSPATTSATTYTVRFRTSSGTSVNFPQQSGTAAIILMEIAA